MCQGQQTDEPTGMFQCSIAHCNETVQVFGGVLWNFDSRLLNSLLFGEHML